MFSSYLLHGAEVNVKLEHIDRTVLRVSKVHGFIEQLVDQGEIVAYRVLVQLIPVPTHVEAPNTTIADTMSVHHASTPRQYTTSVHHVSTLRQYTTSVHHVSTLRQYTYSIISGLPPYAIQRYTTTFETSKLELSWYIFI